MPVTLAQSLSLLIRTLSNCKKLKQKTTYRARTKVKAQSSFTHCWIQSSSNTFRSGSFPPLSSAYHRLSSFSSPWRGCGLWQLQENLSWGRGGCYSSNFTSLQVQVHSSSEPCTLQVQELFLVALRFTVMWRTWAMGPLLKQSPWSAGNDVCLI